MELQLYLEDYKAKEKQLKENYSYFEAEHPRLAAGFAETIDMTYDACSNMDDDRFRDAIADALDVFFHPNTDLI